jgi:predicted Fe-Mo cluster-binding NifX family protein
MSEKIIVTVWNEIVSPLFDSANEFICFSVDGSRTTIQLKSSSVLEKVDAIKNSGSNVLICGAISNFAFNLLTEHEIKVIANIKGSIKEVIDAYINGTLNFKNQFMLPGCKCAHRHARGKRGCGRKGRFK